MPDDKDSKVARAAEIDRAIKEADQKKQADAEAAAGNLDRPLTHLDSVSTKLDECFKRMDAMEAERKKGDAKKDGDENGEGEDKLPGSAKEVVADDADRQLEIELANAQERADSVAVLFAEKSPPPLSGESLRAYRCRLLRRYQRFSPEFAKVDLSAIPDDAAFQGIENRVYADAAKASERPDAAPGQLRMVSKRTPSGHTVNTFYGDIRAWLDPLSGRRQYVTRINPKGHSTD